MNAQTAKIMVVFLFAWTLVSAGGCFKSKRNDRDDLYKDEVERIPVIKKKSWLRLSSWFPTKLEPSKKKFEQQKTKLDQITENFKEGPLKEIRKLPGAYRECEQECKEANNASWLRDDIWKYDDECQALAKCDKDFEEGMKKYEVALKKYNKDRFPAMKKIEAAWGTYSTALDNEMEMNFYSDAYVKAFTTYREAIEGYQRDFREANEAVERQRSWYDKQKKNNLDDYMNESGNFTFAIKRNRKQPASYREFEYEEMSDSNESMTTSPRRIMDELNDRWEKNELNDRIMDDEESFSKYSPFKYN